jgi:dihydrodipicolinate synthase/N-acetylneuraminate lyase
MERLTRQTLRGIWAPVLLPIRSDESIDWDLLEAELDYLLHVPLAGIYTNGTASEFYALTEEEDGRLSRLVADRCHATGMAFQLGASHMSAPVSIERIHRAVELAPSAIQVILPDWLHLSDVEVVDVVRRLAIEAQGVPIVLYNPPHAKTQVSPRLFGELARSEPSLIGIKVAGGDAAWFAQMRAQTDDLAIFVAGHLLASGVQQGAAGSYSNVACLNPVGAVRWWDQMRSDPAGALDLEVRINAFLAEHIQPFVSAGYANPALDKALAAVGGWCAVGTRARWPHRWISDEVVAVLRAAALDSVPELLP